MNKYEIRVHNAIIMSEGLNEWSAMNNLCIFEHIGEMIDFVRTNDKDTSKNFAWIYQVQINGKLTIAYVKRV